MPTIAAINSHPMGGGLELALACDIRFAGVGVRLGLPEVRLGLLPSSGGTQELLEAVGKSRALEIPYSGSALGAEETERARSWPCSWLQPQWSGDTHADEEGTDSTPT